MREWIDICEDSGSIRFEVVAHEYLSNRWTVTAYDGGDTAIGYATFKRASNDYVKGKNVFRVGYYTIFNNLWLRKGIGTDIIRFFEKENNAIVIPSGAFGAKGRLTDSGYSAAKSRLERDKPDWLPVNWMAELENAIRVF